MTESEKISVLVVEDNPGDARLINLYLKNAEEHIFEVKHVSYLADAITAIKDTFFNIVLLDLSLPDSSGVATISKLIETAPYTAIVVMTGIYDGLLAVNVIAAGAQDFLVKGDADATVLERIIINAMQRAEMHLQLQKAQESHHAVMESSNDAIITTNSDGLIQTWNRAACEIFKYHSSDMLGFSCESILSGKSKNKFNLELELCLKKQDEKRQTNLIEFEGCRSNGDIFPIEVSFSSWRIQEGVFSSIVLRDITERRRTEQLKNEFVSTVSHELRTPLTAIMGSLQLIAGGIMGAIPDKVNDMLTVAINNSERLLLIINDILDMNKIESNNLSFNKERIEVKTLVEQAITDNQAYVDKNKAEIQLHETQKGRYLDVDRTRMLQVLANLISNAAKFSHENGIIKINVSVTKDKLRIAIHDNGSGVPDEFRSRIFQKFAQADSTDTRAPGGTGLGLSISKSLVENMGGTINFISKPDIETIFFVDFPLHERKH